jgi:hypothetical protein
VVLSGLGMLANGLMVAAGGIKAVGLAMMTNPIFLALAALAAVVYLVIDNWKSIEPYFLKTLDAVGRIVSGAWERLKDIFFRFTPLGIIIANWGAIPTYLGGLVDTASALVSGAWEIIRNVFSFSVLGLITGNWEPLKDYFAGLMDQIMAIFSTAWNFIQAKLDAVKAPLQWLGDKLGGLFGGDDPPPGQSKSLARAAAMVATPSPPPALAAGAAMPAPAPVPLRPVAPAAAKAASTAAALSTPPAAFGTQVSQDKYEITVHAAPGMDEAAVGREVQRQLDLAKSRDRAAARTRLYDGTE